MTPTTTKTPLSELTVVLLYFQKSLIYPKKV